MNKTSEIVLVLDRSGSMETCWSDTIGGLNTFVEEQKKDGLPTNFSLFAFDNRIERPFISVDINEIPKFRGNEWPPRGGTALLDAIGDAIKHIEEKLSSLVAGDRPNILISVMTDGQENSSRSYSKSHIEDLIKAKTAEGWSFVFLSASMDAVTVGSSYGFVHSAMLSTTNMSESMELYSKGTTLFKTRGVVDHENLHAQTMNYMSHEGAGTPGFPSPFPTAPTGDAAKKTRALKDQVKST